MRVVSMERGMLEFLRASLILRSGFKIISILMFTQMFNYLKISSSIK